ncbi:hypothetical protein AU476_40930, partial [Cupriavidus sp. UYMSc13B]
MRRDTGQRGTGCRRHAAPAYTGQIIVRWRDGAEGSNKTPAAAADALKQLSERTGIAVTARRAMGGNLHLLQVPDAPGSRPGSR